MTAGLHIIKPDNFLRFNFLGYAHEREHLRQMSLEEQDNLEDQIQCILNDHPDETCYNISKMLCTNDSKLASFNVKISRIYKRLKASQTI